MGLNSMAINVKHQIRMTTLALCDNPDVMTQSELTVSFESFH